MSCENAKDSVGEMDTVRSQSEAQRMQAVHETWKLNQRRRIPSDGQTETKYPASGEYGNVASIYKPSETHVNEKELEKLCGRTPSKKSRRLRRNTD